VADDARPEAAVHGRRIVMSRPADLVLQGNPELLRQAVENILRNAIRYSPENSEVTVAVTRENKNIVIEVRDLGPGVPEAELQRIFDPFYRVSRARDRKGGGTGLGLAITARVVSLHAGQLFAKNGADGGLVVTISLPAMAASLSGSAIPAETFVEPVSALSG
jgi:signal transduction histidine kinase